MTRYQRRLTKLLRWPKIDKLSPLGFQQGDNVYNKGFFIFYLIL